MKTHTNLIKGLLASIAFGCITTLSFAKNADEKRDAATEAEGPKLMVVVEDLSGRANFETESARENLLQSAFYDAAKRNEWLGEYEFRYNKSMPKEANGFLKFNVIRWERSRAGFFEYTMSAKYIDTDGKSIDLGTHSASRSSITVTSRYDVSDLYKETAKEAFEDALEALFKKTR